MLGILTEKPSAGRNFAKALGGPTGVYNGEKYKIVSARGHLYEYVNPEEMVDSTKITRYKSWNISNLPWDENDFNWATRKKEDTSKLLSQLKKELSECNEIIIATDDDPTGEGELLAWEILDGLKLHPRKWSRMYFVDESEREIQKAFKNRKKISSMETDMDYVKAKYRSKFDYMTMQFTRVATKLGDGESVLRQGRLKSAMVQIVGDGIKAVDEYKKTPYYQNRFKDENGNVFTNPDEAKFPDKSSVPITYTESKVIIDTTENKSLPPKRLLDLSALSSYLAAKGIKAKNVLDVYQKMYEAHIVSYPRTEDKVITPEQFSELLPLVEKIANVVGIDVSLITHRTPRSTHVRTGGAHGANRPGPVVPKHLSDLNKFGSCAADIYTLLAKSYLAMMADDYTYVNEKGHLEKYPKFKASVNIPLKAGWKAIYDFSDDKDDDGNHLGSKAKPFIFEGFPKKPTYPTMKWLMTQLEKNDVGTGATRVSIYADVTNDKTKYPLLIEGAKSRITMSKFGKMSYTLLPNTHIGSIALTEELMTDMRNIASGKSMPEDCLKKIQTYVKEDIATMRKNRVALGIAEKESSEVERYDGIWRGKSVSFKKKWGSYTFSDEECADLCAGKTIEINGLMSSSGSTYGIVGKLAKQKYKGSEFVGFQKTGFAERKTIPNEFCKHTFSAKEKENLNNGKEVFIEGMLSKKGNDFSAFLKYDADSKKFEMRFR